MMLPQIIPIATPFDYSVLAPEVAALAKHTADKIRLHQRRTTAEMISIGADLIQVKEAVGHGHFGQWLSAEFSWTDRTARNYIRAAERFGTKSETVSVLAPATIYLLSAKSTPETIAQEVVSKLETGEPIDLGVVEAQVETARHDARQANQKRLRAQSRAARKRREQSRTEDNVDAEPDEPEPGIEDEIEPDNYRSAYFLRADHALCSAAYSGPIDDEIIAMARQVAAAWHALAQRLARAST